jgi:hypothetical protein
MSGRMWEVTMASMGVSSLYFLPLLQVEDEWKDVRVYHGLYGCIQPLLPAFITGGE